MYLNQFFMDLVDNFCFTSMEEPPEKKVLDALLEFIISKTLSGGNEKKGTREMTPFETSIDSSPVVRSFLLQLCLKCDKELAMEHIQTFMAHKKEFLDCEDEIVELSQLYMNCVQDMNLQRIYNTNNDTDTALILRSIEILNENTDFGGLAELDVTALDAFSNIRLALGQVARTTAHYIEEFENVGQNRLMMQLIKVANEFMKEANLGAKNFLVREICIKYRVDAVNEMKKHDCLLGLLPDDLIKDNNSVPDLFHISGRHYQQLKSQMIKCLIKNDFSELKDYFENYPDQNQIMHVLLQTVYNCLYIQTQIEVTQERLSNLKTIMEAERNRWDEFPKVNDLINKMLQSEVGIFKI